MAGTASQAHRVDCNRSRIGRFAAAAALGTVLAATAAWGAEPPGPLGNRAIPAPGLQLAALAAQSNTTVRIVIVRRGGTLEGALRGAGVSRGEAGEAIRALSRLFDPRTLMPGQEIELRFTNDGEQKLWSVRLPLSDTRGIVAVAAADGAYLARTYDPSGEEQELIAAGPLLWVEGGVTTKSLTVRKGQTLMNVAVALGANRAEADPALGALSRLFNVRRLQIGQVVTATFGDGNKLLGFGVSVDGDLEVAAYLSEGGDFQPLRTTGADRQRFAAEAEALRATQPAPAAPAAPAIEPRIAAHDLETLTGTVQRGDTVLEVAMRLGARGGEALTACQALSALVNLRRIGVGQQVTAVLGTRDGDDRRRLLSLSISVDGGAEIAALLSDDGTFDPLRTTKPEREQLVAVAVHPAPAAQKPAGPAAPPATPPAAGAPAPKIRLAVAEEPGPPTGPRLAGFDHTSATLIVSRGDTLMDAAVTLGARAQEAYDATAALADIFNPRRLRVGQVVTATFGRLEEGERPRLLAFTVAVNANSEAAAFLSDGGRYTPRRLSKDEAEQMIAALGTPQRPAVEPAMPAPPPPPPEFDWVATIDRTITVNRGDTLMEAVMSAGATANDAYEAIEALKDIFDPRRLRAGQSLKITFAQDGESGWDDRLLAVNVVLAVDREVAALRNPDGAFTPYEIWKPLEVQTVRVEGVIENSLFLAAERAELPMNTIMELIRLYSWDVDFQRDIQTGDRFEVFFETLHDETGAAVKEGNILYAAMTLSETRVQLYRYETPDGIIDYYNEQGHSVRKALLRTPVNGARLSSGFGMRRHPILGYSRMHQGIDFAAPSGTPILAAGDGVIEVAGRNGGYGNYIRIRHNSEHKTAYAHMSRFASGIHAGVRVRQGQTIGYVGSTGASTGPHLHYEVMVNGGQVNPMNLKLPTGKRLEGVELAGYERARSVIDERMAGTDTDFAVAEADSDADAE